MEDKEERFLPEVVICPSIPNKWTPEKAVKTIKKLTTVVKPKVAEIINEFWIAHEVIVKKKVKGWTWGKFCEKAGYHRETPLDWFKKYNLPFTQIAGTKAGKPSLPKPSKTQTKPETKARIEKVVEAIKTETVTDDDLKAIVDVIADKVAKKEVEVRVGTKMATAVKTSFKKGVIPEPKEIDNFDRLSKHALALAEGLNFWADGTMKPETEHEGLCAKIVMDAAPSILIHYVRLGLNIEKVLETFTFADPNRREKHEETKSISS